MSQLVGYAFSGPAEAAGYDRSNDLDRVINRMVDELVFSPDSSQRLWKDEAAAFFMVDHCEDGSELQPVSSPDGSKLLFLDGEVFGYQPASVSPARGGTGVSRSRPADAAHCLDLFLTHGPQGFEKLNGSFVILVYDRGSGELLIANDRFGSRPLFYYGDRDKLVFGTQCGPLLEFKEIGREIDTQAMFEFFTFQRVFEDRTLFRSVKLLDPATVLRFGGGTVSTSKYWSMEYRPDSSLSRREFAEELAATFSQAVRARVAGGEKAGLFLSGGLDSRAVLGALKGVVDVECITVADLINREVQIANRIAHAAGSRHHYIERSEGHYVDIVDEAVRVGGGLFVYAHAHFIGLFDRVRPICDVVFHGFDPETLFRGTNLPWKKFSAGGRTMDLRSLKPLHHDDLVDSLLENVKSSTWGLDPGRLFAGSYRKELPSSIREMVSRHVRGTERIESAYNRYDLFVVHPRMRHRAALFVISMRPYVRERTVSCDNNLLDLYLRMPPELRADPGLWTDALRILDADVAGVPDANTGLSPYAPYPVIFARRVLDGLGNVIQRHSLHTRGSWPNYKAHIRHNRRFRALVQDTLRDPECLDPSVFDRAETERIMEEHMGGSDRNWELILLLVTFGRWHKLYCT